MKANPFRKYRGFVRGSVLNAMAYKINIYGWLFQSVMTLLAGILLWIAIYKENGGVSINGFTSNEMVAYLLMCQVAPAIGMGADVSFNTVSDDVYEGNIAISLTKPVDYRLRSFAMSLGNLVASFVLLFLPLFTAAWLILVFGMGLSCFTWYNFLFFLAASFFSLLINDSFDFMFGELCFYTQGYFGMMVIKDTVFSLLSGALIPFSFFPSWAQAFLPYLPFASLISTPVNIILGRYSLTETLLWLATSLGYAILIFALSFYSNRRMVRRVESAGG